MCSTLTCSLFPILIQWEHVYCSYSQRYILTTIARRSFIESRKFMQVHISRSLPTHWPLHRFHHNNTQLPSHRLAILLNMQLTWQFRLHKKLEVTFRLHTSPRHMLTVPHSIHMAHKATGVPLWTTPEHHAAWRCPSCPSQRTWWVSLFQQVCHWRGKGNVSKSQR